MNLTKPKPTNNTIRVCGQLTIKKEVALIAEESKLGYTKGDVVKITTRSNYQKNERTEGVSYSVFRQGGVRHRRIVIPLLTNTKDDEENNN